MTELLRFTATGSNGTTGFLPPKFDFIFYETQFEMYEKGKLVRTVNYEDIKEIALVKTWQNNLIINCQPPAINIYKVSDDICHKIREIAKK